MPDFESPSDGASIYGDYIVYVEKNGYQDTMYYLTKIYSESNDFDASNGEDIIVELKRNEGKLTENKSNSLPGPSSYDKAVYEYCVETGKISEESPIYVITESDRIDMAQRGIVKPTTRSIVERFPNIDIPIGEFHVDPHSYLDVTFTASDTLKIAVGVDYGISGISANGSLKRSLGTITEYPRFSTTKSSAQKKVYYTTGEFVADETIIHSQGQIIESATNYVRDRMGYVVDPMEVQHSRVMNTTAYQAILSCSGCLVYSQVLYEPESDEADQLDDGIYTAIRLGLCDEADTERRLITRGEAVQILYKTSQTNLTLSAPSIVDKLNVKIDEDFNGKCAPYLEAASKLPEVILNRFDDEGWSLVIGNDFIDQWSTENKISAAGLTHYANKSIYVRSSTSVTHEFGHFLQSELGRPLIVGDLFEKEAEQARPVLGNYATTNKNEYFAEFFDKWFNYTDDQHQRLQEAAPETYAYFAELEKQGWLAERT